MPKWLQELWGIVADGISYDVAKVVVGSLIVGGVGAAIGKITNRLETLKEAISVGLAIFIATAVVITLISPRAQTPQLGGNIENVLAGPLNNTGTIAVFTVDVVNSGTMQSIIKNWSVTATVNSINYRGSILVPPPPNLTFSDLDAPTGAPRAITFHGQDSLLDKASVPIPTGGETTGLLFIVSILVFLRRVSIIRSLSRMHYPRHTRFVSPRRLKKDLSHWRPGYTLN
jgi:hypothetical protein